MPGRLGIFSGRVAPDELLLIGPAAAANDLLLQASQHLQRVDPDAIAIDLSDAWTVWTVRGSDVGQVWARLSENRLPKERPAFIQGAVASVGCKAIMLASVV